MLLQAFQGMPGFAHVIVVGNEKGGSGKSTTCLHIAVALLKAGQRVATIDLDSRQKSLTHSIENRCAWAARTGLTLATPDHHCVARAEGTHVGDNEGVEFSAFNAALTAIEHSHDFVVVDTPGVDNYLMRLAHSLADTLVTPLNDSFVDFDVLGTIDPATFAVTGSSHYADMVRACRRQRRTADGGLTDWVVLRNRLSSIGSRNKRLVAGSLDALAAQLGFRLAEGFSERVVYREFFPRGLTALDELSQATLGVRPTLSHLAARHEVRSLVDCLRLPVDERGRRRAAARAEWAQSMDQPLEMHDVLAD
jgi:chromosome partitioning protein